MGTFRVEVQAVGGHGCQREVKSGETVAESCGNPSCPDCAARAFVQVLKAYGCSVESAKLVHWPGQPTSVTDDLLSRERQGSF